MISNSRRKVLQTLEVIETVNGTTPQCNNKPNNLFNETKMHKDIGISQFFTVIVEEQDHEPMHQYTAPFNNSI